MFRGTNDARRRRPFSGALIKRGGEKGEERKADGESAASENVRKHTGANPRLRRPKVVVKAGQKVKQPGVTL